MLSYIYFRFISDNIPESSGIFRIHGEKEFHIMLRLSSLSYSFASAYNAVVLLFKPDTRKRIVTAQSGKICEPDRGV